MHESGNTSDLLFTFFTEKEGSTIIEQFRARSMQEAILNWYKQSQICPGEPVGGGEPVSVDTVENVWCFSGLDPNGRLYLTHVIATEQTRQS